MSDSPNRIDYDDNGNLDDVALGDVEMFRLEYMDDRTIWIAVIRKDGTEDVFWLRSGKKIKGHHEKEPACPTRSACR